jgi:transcription elongation factor GreA
MIADARIQLEGNVTNDSAMTLTEAVGLYLETLPGEQRGAALAELQRFAKWAGAERRLDELRGHQIASYAETFTGTMGNASQRAETIRAFFAYAKKAGLTDTNLGVHLRVRKTAASSKPKRATAAPKQMTLSEGGKAALDAELESLKAQRPQILADITRARADKDFRENSPLDAARERQGYVEGRIREIEATLQHAVIQTGERPVSSDFVNLGSTVLLRNLKTAGETRYTLVSPAEVNPKEGRISSESPVGKALLQRKTGEEVEVTTPSGALRFRIERIEA